MTTPHLPCDIDELRTLFLFEKLSDEQLDWLCRHGHVEHREPGFVIREGDPGDWFYVLLEGTIALSRRVGADDVEISRTDQVGVYAGAWMAYLGDRVPNVYNASVRAITPIRLYALTADDFGYLMREWFPMPVHLLEGLFFGGRSRERAIGERERLLALGSLSASLTHELNNPAAAAVRATSSLRERVAGMRHKLAVIAGGAWDRQSLETLIKLQETAVERAAKAQALDPMAASDREDEISDWFDAHNITGGYDNASTFVSSGIDVGWLEQIAETAPGDMLEGAIRWLGYTLETELLMNEIEDSTERISNLVTAVKQYSQMDRAPFQVVDVHELIDSTLVMLSRKLGTSVQVVKEYDRSLPDLPLYAAEVNQVWTNLIDNALQAMDGHGTLTLTTRRSADGEHAEIEVADTGPGIPEAIQPRIFEPFFTTKAAGEGTGLGLDISRRIVVNKHHGDLTVTSRPGDTRFLVRLPLRGPVEEPADDGSPTRAEAGLSAVRRVGEAEGRA